MPGQESTRWGWHQLSDEWACRLVRSAEVHRGDLVLDVGAGNGAITKHLVAASARVLAVELHPRRASVLRATFAADDVKVLQVDASDLWLPARPFRVVANPPFAITTSLLRRLLGPRSALVRADLVVPRHVAARWAGGRGHRGTAFEMELTAAVPRVAFHPPARGETAILSIVRRPLRRKIARRMG